MSFKIEPKDLKIFTIYVIVLLYVCSLVVANLGSLLEYGEFSGIIPVLAFTPTYLPITLILFFGSLIAIFASVSSYIFHKDKGGSLGLNVKSKGSDGYARWATNKEIEKQPDIVKVTSKQMDVPGAGIPIINNDKGMYVDDGDYHNLVIGSTGCGKSQTIVKPMVNLLARKGESMIITDPKGEIYRGSVKNLEAKGYNVIILNFRDPERGNTWNPLSLPYEYYQSGNKDKANELVNDVAKNIFVEENAKDPFWGETSADYFAGLALGLFEDAEKNEINFKTINYMSTVGEEKYAGNSTYIKEYFTLKGEESLAYMFASSTISAPNETKGSIMSTFKQKIRIFSSTEKLSEMLATSNFDMKKIGSEKTAVFLVIHDEKKTYHALMTIFIKQCYEVLIDVAQQNKGGKLKYRTNFILDEFANMPALKDVDSMVSAARSRSIRFTFIIQNFAQLYQVYGENIGEVIKGNCGNIIYLISTEIKALDEISKMCGEVKSKEKDKTSSTPLITVSDLQKLKQFQAIIKRIRTDPFKTDLKPDFKIDWGEQFDEGDFPTRDLNEVKLFDVKKFVSEEKRKRQAENGNNMNQNPFGGTMSPFGGGASSFGGGANPFGGGANPFGGGANPFGGGANPFDGGINSYPRANQPNLGQFGNSNINPFAKTPTMMDKPITNPKPASEGTNNLFSDMDIDAMLKDIDNKIKEFEEKEKEEQISPIKDKEKPIKLEKEPKKKEQIIEKPIKIEEIKEAKIEEIIEEKPIAVKEVKEIEYFGEYPNNNLKVSVDTESKIVLPTEITDDEFYDDFFE